MSEFFDPNSDEDCTICFCRCVPKSRIIQVIEEGAETLAEIQDQTGASTGCGGCEPEVLEILENELSKKKAPKAESA